MGWWNWESQNWGLLRMGDKTASSRSCTVTPGRLNYCHHAARRVKTVGGCSPGLHGKAKAVPALKRTQLPISKHDAGLWGLMLISGHCLVWGCSAGGLTPASRPEFIPALFLRWLAQPVLCPAQGNTAWASASAGQPVLQTGMGDGTWQPGASPPLTPHILRPQPCSLQGAGLQPGCWEPRRAQALPQAGFCHPKWQREMFLLYLQPHQTAWEPPAGCRPPSTKKGRNPTPATPGGAMAAAGQCRKG